MRLRNRKLIQNMPDPIDFIDLTIDSPLGKHLRVKNKNVENISNNNATTKPKKSKSKRRTIDLEDSVMEVPAENTCKNAEVMEIIDVDSISEKTGLHCVNDSSKTKLTALTCPICFEQISSAMKPTSTRCGHIFCFHCLELALRQTKKCPMCKKAAKLQACTRLYL
ncbi:uncharacterized protein LOC143424587 [Xylocopa sonorina]|uniref:uncharacterized protein LOC143424587 n=1 Tax=Xylocopa sonorina TaxID=1818115 RepID=UPI00403AEBBE